MARPYAIVFLTMYDFRAQVVLQHFVYIRWLIKTRITWVTPAVLMEFNCIVKLVLVASTNVACLVFVAGGISWKLE